MQDEKSSGDGLHSNMNVHSTLVKMISFMLFIVYNKRYFERIKSGEPRARTLHFNCSRRGRGAVVVCCYAGINPTVLGHQIADLQGDFP